MPIYEYRCTECGHQFDIQQAFSDDPLSECPECAGRLKKLLSAPGISFKGSGFYKNDARTGSKTGRSSESTSSSTSDTASSSSSPESSSTTSTSSGDASSKSSGSDSSSTSKAASSTSSSSTSD